MRNVVILSYVASMLTACAGGEEFEYDEPDEIPIGPGLLSGEDGKFTIFVPYPDWD